MDRKTITIDRGIWKTLLNFKADNDFLTFSDIIEALWNTRDKVRLERIIKRNSKRKSAKIKQQQINTAKYGDYPHKIAQNNTENIEGNNNNSNLF